MESFQHYLDIAKGVVERRAVSAPTTAEAQALYTFVIGLQSGLEPTQFVNEVALKTYWERNIRSSIWMVSSVLGMVAEFRFLAGFSRKQWEDFVEVVTNAVSVGGSSSQMDSTLTERTPSYDSILKLLQDNPWAVLIIVLSFTSPLNRIKRANDE